MLLINTINNIYNIDEKGFLGQASAAVSRYHDLGNMAGVTFSPKSTDRRQHPPPKSTLDEIVNQHIEDLCVIPMLNGPTEIGVQEFTVSRPRRPNP